MDACVFIRKLIAHTTNINTMLQINYTPIKIKLALYNIMVTNTIYGNTKRDIDLNTSQQ